MGENSSGNRPGKLAGGAIGYVRSRNRRQKAAGVAGAALIVSAPFGGLDASAKPEPDTFRAGETVDIGPFEVTIKKVVTVGDLAPSASPSKKGNRLLVIDAMVHNPGDRPEFSTLLDKMFIVEDGGVTPGPGSAQPAAPSIFHVADGIRTEPVNPGLTYEMAFVFEQEAGWQQKPVTIKVRTFEYVDEGSLTLDEDYWAVDDATAATAVIPVEVKP